MAYRVTVKASAEKSLLELPALIQQRIVHKSASLADNPRPPGCKKLRGGNYWRVRVGDYRIVYEIDDRAQNIDVRIIAHHREVYRDM